MVLKYQQAEIISDYLQNHSEAFLGKREPYEIDGKRHDLDVIRLPLDLLLYSIRNGRFAAELQELEATEGRRLDPEKVKDALKIEELLLRDKAKSDWLKWDIERVGQLQPATITFDGFIINGNRRAAILNQLHREKGDPRFTFLEAVRLPENVTSSDLWRFEAGFQLAVELKADYGPVNELLKIKEGREYGLQDQEIALILGGDNTIDSVKKKLKVLELIEDYLVYFGQDKRYSYVEGRVEHFIDIVNITQKSNWKKLSTVQKKQVIHAAYHMIHDAKIAHLDLRRIGQFVNDPKTAIEFANEILQECGVQEETSNTTTQKTLNIIPLEDEIQELEAQLLPQVRIPPKEDPKITQLKDKSHTKAPKTPAESLPQKEKLREIFDTTSEKVALVQQKKKPGQILKRVESNLQALNELSGDYLKQYADDFHRIEKLVKELAARFG